MTDVTKKIRVNLWVHTTEGGKAFYHVIHIGFFAPSVVSAVVDNIDARSIVFAGHIDGATGRVDVMTADMRSPNAINVLRHSYEYAVRTPREEMA